jgi:hypothetical protein
VQMEEEAEKGEEEEEELGLEQEESEQAEKGEMGEEVEEETEEEAEEEAEAEAEAVWAVHMDRAVQGVRAVEMVGEVQMVHARLVPPFLLVGVVGVTLPLIGPSIPLAFVPDVPAIWRLSHSRISIRAVLVVQHLMPTCFNLPSTLVAVFLHPMHRLTVQLRNRRWEQLPTRLNLPSTFVPFVLRTL